MAWRSRIFGDPNQKYLKEIQPLIEKINALEEKLSVFSDQKIKEEFTALRPAAEKGAFQEILPMAFALGREAAKRTLGQRHYDVQLIGGVVLHRGEIAEMKTGEGKTLVATLSLYLNALEGKGVHLITVNDYLARVGAGWMANLYYALGLSTSVIVHDAAYMFDPEYDDKNQYDERLRHFRPISRREAYYCDVTYGTNNEFGFDYLRDNMAIDKRQLAQRPFNFAIVDEVDSILIDEARTPLIISAPAEESASLYQQFAQLIPQLEVDKDYSVDEKDKAVTKDKWHLKELSKTLGTIKYFTSIDKIKNKIKKPADFWSAGFYTT